MVSPAGTRVAKKDRGGEVASIRDSTRVFNGPARALEGQEQRVHGGLEAAAREPRSAVVAYYAY
jgi:hypothetical protein